MKDTQVDDRKRSISVSGTAEQVRLAEWLAKELDKPGLTEPSSHSSAAAAHRYVAGADDVVGLFHIQNAKTTQDFQEFATMLRSLTETRRTFTVNAPKVIAMPGTGEQIRLSEWLINELDQPMQVPLASGGDPAVRAYTMSDPAPENPKLLPENDVRVFFFTHTASIQEFQEITTAIRSITETRRMFTPTPSARL